MATAFKMGYSLAVALLFVLFVILGTRTFYDEPEEPQYPGGTGYLDEPIFIECDFQISLCYDYRSESSKQMTLEEARRLYPDQVKALEEQQQAQREYDRKYEQYQDDLVDYHRNVFILASVLGVAAVAAGVYLFRRVEAMPLGLLLGGLGVVIFGWVQAAGDFDEIGMAPLFAVVAVGLALVLAAGYWLLGTRGASGGDGG